jgi:hypothetical protein
MPVGRVDQVLGLSCEILVLDFSVYVLVAILKRELKIGRSLTEILQILRVTPFEKTPTCQALSTTSAPHPECACCNQLKLSN